MLRRVAGYLNQTIALAVEAANTNPSGVHFTFVDVNTGQTNQSSVADKRLFEPSPGDRHNLCATTPWLNGISTQLKNVVSKIALPHLQASFHPTQIGHDNEGDLVAERIRGLDWTTLSPPETTTTPTSTTTTATTSPPPTAPVPQVSIQHLIPPQPWPGTVIDVQYPVLTGGNFSEANSALRDVMVNYTDGIAATLRADVGLPGCDAGGAQGKVQALTVTSAFVSFGWRLHSSYRDCGTSFGEGRGLTWDLTTGKAIQLEQLFSAPNGRDVARQVVQQEMIARDPSDSQTQQLPAVPDERFFTISRWAVSPVGIVFVFDGGTAAGTEGEVDGTAPWDQIRTALSPLGLQVFAAATAGLQGGPGFVPLAPCVAIDSMVVGMTGHRSEVALFQSALKRLGYDPGAIDGEFGNNTMNAAAAESLADGQEGAIEFTADEGGVLQAMFLRLGIACP
jgi:hypothetical protein